MAQVSPVSTAARPRTVIYTTVGISKIMGLVLLLLARSMRKLGVGGLFDRKQSDNSPQKEPDGRLVSVVISMTGVFK